MNPQSPDPLLALSAPPNSLPTWAECERRVEVTDFLETRSQGGPSVECEATALHRFIHEYDPADPIQSEWFLHRLELLLNEEKEEAATYWRNQHSTLLTAYNELLAAKGGGDGVEAAYIAGYKNGARDWARNPTIPWTDSLARAAELSAKNFAALTTTPEPNNGR